MDSLYLLDLVDFYLQVRELYNDKQFEPALNLCRIVNRTQETIPADFVREIQLQNGYTCFAACRFKEAMDSFVAAEADPTLVVALFPDLLPRYVRDLLAASMDRHGPLPIASQALAEQNLRLKALEELIPFLKKQRQAGDCLEPLADPLAHDTSPQGVIAASVDTALLKAYITAREDEAQRFVTVTNRCVVEDSERALKKEQKWLELVLFYQQKGLHRRALVLLKKLGQEALKEHGRPPRSAPAGPRDGFDYQYTVEYLQRLNNSHQQPVAADVTKLILEFSVWVLQAVPLETALPMFLPLGHPVDPAQRYLLGPPPLPARLDRTGAPVTAVPAPAILKHLEDLAKVIDGSAALRMRFLEEALYNHRLNDPKLHEALILLYLECLRTSQGPARQEVINRLADFLRRSDCYEPTKMLTVFPTDELPELRAILLSKTGQHGEALDLYAHRMNEPTKAMEYCQSLYDPAVATKKDVYVQLLRTYLQPSGAEPPKLDAALAVLANNFTRMDPLQALELLPDDTPVETMSAWLTAVMQHTSLQRRSLQIKRNLLKTKNIATHEEYVLARNKGVTIDDRTACRKCGKKIGNAVFAWYASTTAPDLVVHYQCMVDPTLDPIKGKRLSGRQG